MTNQNPNNIAPLDITFADNGAFTVPVPVGYTSLIPMILTLAPGGDSYIAGPLQGADTTHYACIHLSEQGELDKNFGNDGYAIGRFDESAGSNAGSVEHIMLVQIKGQQRILLLGSFFMGPEPRQALVLLHLDGQPDESFGHKGTQILKLPTKRSADSDAKSDSVNNAGSPGDTGTSILILPDSRILLILDWQFITLLKSDGSLDTSFNNGGFLEPKPANATRTSVQALMRTDDGKFVAAGWVRIGALFHAVFLQFDEQGQLDLLFGDQGYFVGDGSGNYSEIYHLNAQPNKRILGVGSYHSQGLLVSLEPDGKPNIQFNGGKSLKTELDNSETHWYGSTLLSSSGHLLVAGRSKVDSESANVVIARVLNKGELDMSYGNGTGYWRFPDTYGVSVSLAFMEGKVLFISWTVGLPARVMRGLIADNPVR